MAETSGFFQAMWDDGLKNPITEEYTGWWDRDYVAKQFMQYFSLFVGNGVFVSPTNQLKVMPGTGLSIIIKEGWAYINGGWYHNDADLEIPLVTNATANSRVDSVRIRYSESDRSTRAYVFTGDTTLVRGDMIYDLEIAQVIVAPNAFTITSANITDTRGNENSCGFVKGLLEVVSTDDLFAQFEAMFDEWFATVKDQVTGDLAIRLQAEFEQINVDIIEYKNEVTEYYNQVQTNITQYEQNMQSTVDNYKQATDEQIMAVGEMADEKIAASQAIVQNFVDKDFVLPLQELEFVDQQCVIEDERITADTLVDVYFTNDSIQEAIRCSIYVNSNDGNITLNAGRQPSSTLSAVIRVRVR